ncbi:MAG: hypothetical protein JO115_10030 [Pseudonocardiales bacterium]|nr:hypothetical protein [Pseudonocardiales bacterium]
MSVDRRARGAAAGVLVTIALVISACGGSSGTSQSASTPASTRPGAIGAAEITGPVRGAVLVAALREGGLLLWIRHTERDDRSGTVTPQQAASHDCAAQSLLSATGRQHAAQIGAAIRALDLPIWVVRTARLCRTEATGRLLTIAPVSDDDRLDAASTWVNRGGAAAEQQATLQVLAEAPPAGKDVVLISSVLDIPHPQPAVLGELGPGETAVFRSGPAGRTTLLARIGESAWPTLLPAAPTPR